MSAKDILAQYFSQNMGLVIFGKPWLISADYHGLKVFKNKFFNSWTFWRGKYFLKQLFQHYFMLIPYGSVCVQMKAIVSSGVSYIFR